MNSFFQIFSCVCRENEYRLIRRRQNIEPGSLPQQIQPARREMGIMPQNNSLINMFTGRLGHYIIRMIYFVIKVTEQNVRCTNNQTQRMQYKWRRCSKKTCCKQCGQVKFMGTMTKWPVQKHTEHHQTRSKQGRNRHKEITIFCVFRFFCFLFSIFNYLKDFSRKC